MLAIISRYLLDEKTGDCCFFFQTQSESEKQEWIKAFHINVEWAVRFSALEVSGAGMMVTYQAGDWRLSCRPVGGSGRYVSNLALLSKPILEGSIDVQGESLSSPFSTNWASVHQV